MALSDTVRDCIGDGLSVELKSIEYKAVSFYYEPPSGKFGFVPVEYACEADW